MLTPAQRNRHVDYVSLLSKYQKRWWYRCSVSVKVILRVKPCKHGLGGTINIAPHHSPLLCWCVSCELGIILMLSGDLENVLLHLYYKKRNNGDVTVLYAYEKGNYCKCNIPRFHAVWKNFVEYHYIWPCMIRYKKNLSWNVYDL